MTFRILFALASSLLSQRAIAQTAPDATSAPVTSKWQVYAEAGPSASRFVNYSHGTTTLVPGGAFSPYSREFKVDNTVAAFADVKALHYLTRHLVFAGSAGLDMQQLDFTTTWRATVPGYPNGGSGERVVRLLTRVRVDAGLHAALGLGRAGQLLPGVSLGQLVSVSKNGFSYSIVQPELCYAVGPVLLSARASFMPYNTTIPDIDDIARRDGRAVVEREEYRISEFRIGIGVKL
jgi:hypothetical protein